MLIILPIMEYRTRETITKIFLEAIPINGLHPKQQRHFDDLIEIKREFAKKTGYSLARFSMNTETWEMVLKAEDTKKQVLGITAYNGGIRLQQGQVTEYLRGYGIEIEVYDKLYIDPADGATKYFIPTGVISAQSSGVYLEIMSLERHRKREAEV